MSLPDRDIEATERTGGVRSRKTPSATFRARSCSPAVVVVVGSRRALTIATKHGDQSHLPDGTGPRVRLEAMAGNAFGLGMDLRADDLARWAKARCKAASQNEGGNGTITYEHILTEEWAEALAESDPAALRAELIQLAAVAVQWVETLDRRGAA